MGPLVQVGADAVILNALDTGFGGRVIGYDRHLPAQVRFGLVAHGFKVHCQKRDRNLLTAGHQGVIFAAVG